MIQKWVSGPPAPGLGRYASSVFVAIQSISARYTNVSATIAANARIAQEYPALAQAAAAVAGPAHRNAATLGGNLCADTRCVFYNQSEWWRAANRYCLKRGGDTCHVAPQGARCHAAFSGDVAPALIALDASVEVSSVKGTRRLPLAQLYRDAGIAPREGLRLKGTDAVERGLDSADDDTVLDAMAAEPILIERPLVETEKGVRLCRPSEKVAEIL